jgi:heme exporter protein B
VPLLVIPVLAPVLLGAGQAADAALFGSVADGWPWVGALAAFALLYVGVGIVSFDSLLEEM